MSKKDKAKLRLWQDRLSKNQVLYESELSKMDAREDLYLGSKSVKGIVKGDKTTETPHVRNICAELVEAQVNSNIPMPKVTAKKKGDELKAKLIEDMLRSELDRMPFETINDLMERCVTIQGGAGFLIEWDNTKSTHTSIGDVNVSTLHPKQIIPQYSVYSGIEDMDYIIIKAPVTKEYILKRYDVDVSNESESEPDIKSSSGDTASDDMVTQYIAYYRNKNGGIGLYSWCGDYELCDYDDYQARRIRRCATCGADEPLSSDIPDTNDFINPLEFNVFEKEVETSKHITRGNHKKCPFCSGEKWEEVSNDFEELFIPAQKSNGEIIGGNGEKIPFYKPDIYPVILQKNVSVYGRFLGDSDIDKISDQQNTINRLEAKIIDKIIKGGSYLTLPADAKIEVNSEEVKIIRPESPADKSMIDVITVEADISQDMAYLSLVYEEARQAIGITDSFQGRRDTTATSGKAKEFSAAQSAGRLESKRIMKDAAYSALFEAIFKFKLAYADEPRPVISKDANGNVRYDTFNRFDFLEKDDAGEWYWNDAFTFTCDTSAPLANNREVMWQEARMNLQTGAFGDPASLDTLILFWTKMEALHYPGASETKAHLEAKLQEQKKAQVMQSLQAQQMHAQNSAAVDAGTIIQKARADAQKDFNGI